MANEFLFLIHAVVGLIFTFAAVSIGREALVAWVSLQGVLANLFVLKQIDCFNLTITCSDIYVIGSILALNFIQEFYGKQAAIQATFISFFALVFFSTASYLHVAYEPSLADTTQTNYAAILTVMPWMMLVSMGVFFASQRFDILFFGFLKRLHLPFSLRAAFSMLISQAIDTGLFTFFALRNLVDDPWAVFFVSFIVKSGVVLGMAGFVQVGKYSIKIREHS